MDNRFVKIGNRAGYRTVQCGSGGGSCVGFELIDSVFADGAGYDKLKWRGSGQRSFTVGWTVRIAAEAGAPIVARNKTGETVSTAKAPATGRIELTLMQYRHTAKGRIALTPHRITVGESSKTVTVDKPLSFKVTGDDWKELPVEKPKTPDIDTAK